MIELVIFDYYNHTEYLSDLIQYLSHYLAYA